MTDTVKNRRNTGAAAKTSAAMPSSPMSGKRFAASAREHGDGEAIFTSQRTTRPPDRAIVTGRETDKDKIGDSGN
jgi:hypothetical protein